MGVRRPADTWKRNLERDLTNVNKSWKEISKIGPDKTEWKRHIKNIIETEFETNDDDQESE